MVPALGLCFSYSTGIMLKRTKQKSQGIWADPRGLRHQVRTKTKLFDFLTLSSCTVSEPEIAEQCLRVPWWGLYWYYNASVISIFLKIFERRPISTQVGIKGGQGKNRKRKHLYTCFYLIFLCWIYHYTYCLFFTYFIIWRQDYLGLVTRALDLGLYEA